MQQNNTTAQKPKLTYFNGRGLAEVVRLIFADQGVEFIDHRMPFGDPEFVALKPSLPFGQLPILEINGHTFCQSVSITRYLAKLYNLYGKTDAEQTVADSIIDAIKDLDNQIKIFVDKETENESTIQKRNQWFTYFEQILKNNNGGQGFLVGNDITFADFWIFHIFYNAVTVYPQLADEFPLLNGLYQHVGSRPGVAHWVKTRPESDW